jgi:hypothetical protein
MMPPFLFSLSLLSGAGRRDGAPPPTNGARRAAGV